MLYYDRKDVSEGIHVNRTNGSKRVRFVTIGIFLIKGLSFNQTSAMDAMIHE